MYSSLRSLTRSPLFAFAHVVLLGLAVAMLLSLASASWTLLLKPLPYPNGERLVEVRGWSSKMNFSLDFSPALSVEMRKMPMVDQVGIYHVPTNLERIGGETISAVALDQTSFELLGATPLLGRLPLASASDEVAIAHALWLSEFGGDGQIIGRDWELASGRMRIVGVMPAGFAFPQQSVKVWQGMAMDPAMLAPDRLARWGDYRSIVRLTPGQTVAALQTAVDARLSFESALEGLRQHMGLQVQVEPLRQVWLGDRSDLLLLLLVAAALALLALLANLGSLWLGRCLARRREVEMRQVLGATGWRAASTLYGEILLLCSAGVLLGMLLTPLGLAALRALAVVPIDAPVLPAIDVATWLLAVLAIAVLSALLSLAPWWSLHTRAAAKESFSELLAGGTRTLGQSPGQGRWRQGLLILQLALAVTLLGASALLTRSLVGMLAVDTGFAGRDLVLLDLVPMSHPGSTVPTAAGERLAGFIREVEEFSQVSRLSFASAPPLAGTEVVTTYHIGAENRPEGARERWVGPGYFELLGQPLLGGRSFVEGDSPQTAIIVDQLFAERYLGGAGDSGIAAVGKSLNLAQPDQPPALARVIGVVRTVKHGALDEGDTLGSVYHYAPSADVPAMLPRYLLLRTHGDLLGLRERVEALAAMHGLRLGQYAPVSSWIANSTRARWPLLQLFGGFALTCVLLCLSGLVAQLHFLIQSRRNELGLRAALGATPRRLMIGMFSEQLRLVLAGLGIGAIGVLLAGQLLATQLFQVRPYDPLSLFLAVAPVALLGLVTAWMTTRRGVRVSPIDALRHG